MFDNISVPGAVAIAILVVLVLIVIVRNIYIVQQSKAYVVERLGAFHSVWGVGFHLKVPFIERVVKKVSLKEQVADFDPQPVITKDNVTMQIDTVIYFQITDPKLYTYGVEHPMNAIENLTATTLRNIIGDMELDQSLTSRDTINTRMRAILDEAQRLVREGVDEEFYQQIRRASFGSTLRALNSFENIAVSVADGAFRGFDPFRFPEVYDSVTRADVEAFLRESIVEERSALSILIPKKERASQ